MASKKDDDTVVTIGANGQVVRQKLSNTSQAKTQQPQQKTSNNTVVTMKNGKVVREPINTSQTTSKPNITVSQPKINTSTNTKSQKPTTPLVYQGASINPNAPENEKLRITANNNYNQKLSAYKKAEEDYKAKRENELTSRGISADFLSRFDVDTPLEQKLTKLTREEAKKRSEDAKIYRSAKQDIQNALRDEEQAISDTYNQLKYAKYLKNYSDVENGDINLYDRTLGQVFRGAQDMFSTFTDDNKYVDENGNTTYLPTYNQLKQAKVQDSYGNDLLGGLARFGGDVAYQGAKLGTSIGLNAVAPLSGTALYFTDIYADQYKDNINAGMDNEGAMLNAFLKTGQNYIKQKLIGGIGGKLTGGDTSALENALTKGWAKIASNPKVVSALSSMSAEAIDEFTDTYMETLIDVATRDNVDVSKLMSPDTFLEALYSGAVGGATGAMGGVNPNSLASAQNAINQQMPNQNMQQNIQPNIDTQIQQEQQNNINNQPRLEQQQTGLNEANNNAIDTEQNLINEINNEQRKLDNGTSEDDGYHLAELQKELQEVQKKSIANDSNAFNLAKIDENNTLRSIRTTEDISNRKVNAYQYDNPEVKPFFRDAAYDLKSALENFTTKGERRMHEDGSFGGSKFTSTPQITELKEDYNMSYKDLDKGINGIIKDEGQENNAASKKVELVIDKMLRNGYKSETPDTVKPNQNYLDTLAGKPVNNQINEQVDEELPFYEANEEMQPSTNTEQKQATNEIGENQNANLAERKNDEVIKLTPEQEEKHFIDNGVEPKAAKILSEMPKPEKKPMSEKIKEGKATLRENIAYYKRNFVDKGETIYRLGKKLKNRLLYATYDKMGTTRGEANYSIGKSQADLNGKNYNNFTDKNGNKTSMSLNQIWEGVNPELANEYLAHWLNVDRYNQQTEDGQNKYVFGIPDITPEISQQRIAELEKSNPELKRFGENVWQYGRNMLQNMVDGGLVNPQQAQQFMQETPHYVRLQRNVDKNSKSSLEFDDNGKVRVNKPTKNEFKGSDIDILPFKNSMADYTFDVAKAIRTNLFAQELGKSLSVSSTDDNVTSLDDSFGIRPDLLQNNGDGTYSLTMFNNGVATVIPIDEGIYESLTPNKHYKIEDTLPFKGIRKIDSIRKALLTDKNPMFLATNMMKDLFDAPLNSKYPVEFAKNYPRAIKEIATNGKYYQQYQALGGLQNTYFDKEGFQKQGSKANPLTWIEKGNNAIEQFPRLAEFISTMEKTGDINEAMYNAAEITTNFKRGGDVAKALNRNGATFLNASIQGFDKQIRNFTDIQSPKQAVQLLGKIAVLGIAPALMNDMIYGDDDEYKEMQDYIKDRYYLIKLGNGQWIRIPKGRAVSVFQSAARRTGTAMGGDENAFKGFLNFASTQVAPNNPFENNIISPFVDVARNESWSGNKIVPDAYKDMHASEQWNEKTDEFSKWLGGALNISPMKINYLIDQYSGAIGDVFLPMNTAKTTSATTNPLLKPFADKFTTDAVYSNKNLSTFYDVKSKVTGDYKSVNSDKTDKLKYNYMNSQNTKISELRKEQSKIQGDSNLTKTEKYEQAREIQKEINELAKRSVKDLDNIEDNTYYAKVGDSIYYLDDDGTFKKDSYAESHQKSAEKKGMALYDYYKEKYEARKEKNKE